MPRGGLGAASLLFKRALSCATLPAICPGAPVGSPHRAPHAAALADKDGLNGGESEASTLELDDLCARLRTRRRGRADAEAGRPGPFGGAELPARVAALQAEVARLTSHVDRQQRKLELAQQALVAAGIFGDLSVTLLGAMPPHARRGDGERGRRGWLQCVRRALRGVPVYCMRIGCNAVPVSPLQGMAAKPKQQQLGQGGFALTSPHDGGPRSAGGSEPGRSGPYLFILVMTVPEALDRRVTMRDTWLK